MPLLGLPRASRNFPLRAIVGARVSHNFHEFPKTSLVAWHSLVELHFARPRGKSEQFVVQRGRVIAREEKVKGRRPFRLAALS